MMAAYLMKPPKHEAKDPRWLVIYGRWAAWCVHHRLITMVAASLFFIGSLALIPLLPTGFIPPDDNSQTQVYLELPPVPRWPVPVPWPRMRASAWPQWRM